MSNDLNFGEALSWLRAGKRMSRRGWNGKGMFIFLVPGSEFSVNRAPLNQVFSEGTRVKYHAHIDMKAADGTIFAWNPNILDILAEDWALVD